MGEGCEGYPPKGPLSLLQRLPGVEGPPEGSLKALVAVISQLERLSEASQGGPYVITFGYIWSPLIYPTNIYA